MRVNERTETYIRVTIEYQMLSIFKSSEPLYFCEKHFGGIVEKTVAVGAI